MPQAITPPDELHTYDEWRALGFQVQRGEHHIARRTDAEGYTQYLFGPAQVRPREHTYAERIRDWIVANQNGRVVATGQMTQATPHWGAPPVTEQRPRARLEVQEGPWERFLKIEKQVKGK